MKRRSILILAGSIGTALALGLVTGLVLAKEALLAPAGDTVPCFWDVQFCNCPDTIKRRRCYFPGCYIFKMV